MVLLYFSVDFDYLALRRSFVPALSLSHSNPPRRTMSGLDCSTTGAALQANYIYDTTAEGVFCPTYSPFFGVMGATAAMVFSGASGGIGRGWTAEPWGIAAALR